MDHKKMDVIQKMDVKDGSYKRWTYHTKDGYDRKDGYHTKDGYKRWI